MSIKERVHETNRRRHNGEEGFTLIELLVVILIIAILAAVGIVALLSALNSGKKSAATTTLRNAVNTVKAVQSGRGVQDFSGIDATSLLAEDPDIKFQGGALTSNGDSTNRVAVATSGAFDSLTLHSRDGNGNCFFVVLNNSAGTRYAAQRKVANGTACSLPSTTYDNQAQGWDVSAATVTTAP